MKLFNTSFKLHAGEDFGVSTNWPHSICSKGRVCWCNDFAWQTVIARAMVSCPDHACGLMMPCGWTYLDGRITSFGCVIDTRPHASNQPAGELCLGTPQLDRRENRTQRAREPRAREDHRSSLASIDKPKPIPCVLRENSPRCRLAALSRNIRVTKM
jgi:hypothetical protein